MPWSNLVRRLGRFEPLLFLALAALSMSYRLTGSSLWADEGNSVAQAMRPLPELIQRSALDIHPPLYYVLLHLWTRVFGISEPALRSLSLAAGLAVVVLTWAIARLLWGKPTARIVGILAATHPFLVYYAQEVRMYIFVVLWATLAVYALVRIVLREGRARLALPDVPHGARVPLVTRTVRVSSHHPALLLGRWDVLYALAVAAGLWTHYAFPVLPGVLTLVYVAWMYSTRHRLPLAPRVIRLLSDHLAALVLYVPWLSVALNRVQAWPRPTDVLPLEKGLAVAFQWMALGPVPPAWTGHWLWIWLVLLVVALWPWRRLTPTGYRRPHWLSWGLPLLWLAAPVGMMLLLNLFRPAYLKFLILGLPPFILLAARGIWAPLEALDPLGSRWLRRLARSWLAVTWVAVLVLQGLALANYYAHPEKARDDYRDLVRYIEATASTQDAIILDAPGQWDVFCYYYAGCTPLEDVNVSARQPQDHLSWPSVYALPLERPPKPEHVTARLEKIAGSHRKLFVLLWATDESDPQGLVEHWLDRHAYKALDAWRGHLRFLIYATPHSDKGNTVVQDMDARLGNRIRLRRFVLLDPVVTSGDVAQVRLVWHVTAPPKDRYKVFVQLLGPGDRLIAQRDSDPLGGSAPTTTWQAGATLVDHYGVLVPSGTPPGTYRVIVGMYHASTGQRLPVVQGDNHRDFVAIPIRVTVRRPAVPPPVDILPIRYTNDERWGPLRLLGHDRYKRGFRHAPDTPLHPGDFLHMTLFWKAIRRPKARWHVTIAIVDGWGHIVSSLTDDPGGPTYPTTSWAAGEVVRGEFNLYLPPTLKPGTYGIQVQLWKDHKPVREPVPLGTVDVKAPK